MEAREEDCIVNVHDSSGHDEAAFQPDIQERFDRINMWLAHVKQKPPLFYIDEHTIYPAPVCLKNDSTVSFYHPKEISFGPFHFGFRPEHFQKEVAHFDMEIFKSEVAWRFDGLEQLVGKLKSEEMYKKANESYGGTRLCPEVLAWLLVRDGCFVLEVLDTFSVEVLDTFSVEAPLKTGNGSKTVMQHILDRKNHHALLNDIVKDMFKLENQLPLWVLKEIKETKEGEVKAYWFERALKNLSPVEVREAIGSRKYRRETHLLQLLGEYMVDNEKESEEENHHNQEDEEANQVGNNKKRGNEYMITGLLVIFIVLMCVLLSPFIIIWFLWLVISLVWEWYQYHKWGEADKDDRHVPTVEELHRIGVKFKRLDHKGISHIHFDCEKSTLYLPKFTVDDKSEVIVRNLLVMETHWIDSQKIITRYVVLMNDLVNTAADVSRLRQEGIISNKLGSDDDVARLWNSVAIPATDIPSYGRVDDAARGINDYRKKGLRILWAQFRRVHCSKPWLVASLLGGISLLSLAVVQVVCLFHKCQRGQMGIE